MNVEPESMRLNKALAKWGVASRRGADALIAAGRVSVNGSKIIDLGARYQPGIDVLEVDGRRVDGEILPERTYVVLNKPRRVIVSHVDGFGRETVFDLASVKSLSARLNSIGQLDQNAEGLVLLTDDGDLIRQLAATRRPLLSEYQVLMNRDVANDFWLGLETFSEQAGVAQEVFARRGPSENLGGSIGQWWTVRLGENKDVSIRIFLEKFAEDFTRPRMLRLVRVGLGPIKLGRSLGLGSCRRLSGGEIQKLKAFAALPPNSATTQSAQ